MTQISRSRRRKPGRRCCRTTASRSSRVVTSRGSTTSTPAPVSSLPSIRASGWGCERAIRHCLARLRTCLHGRQPFCPGYSHCQTSQMPLRGSGGDENGRLTLDVRITSCPAWAIFKGRTHFTTAHTRSLAERSLASGSGCAWLAPACSVARSTNARRTLG